MKFVSDLAHGAGSGGFVPARHFYLLSPDGRVYRAYDGIEAPDGDADQFDYDAALAQDPRNTGTYTVSRKGLHLMIGGSHGEPVDDWTVPAPTNGQVDDPDSGLHEGVGRARQPVIILSSRVTGS